MAYKQKKGQTARNISLNIVAFAVQFVINFYISPIIVREVGTAANGFISLANDFVSYASVLASVFNSVAARFIATAYYQREYKRANAYFNSLLVANVVISAILGIIGITVVANLNKLLSIPSNLIFDVKLTFSIVFISYIITLLTLVFTTSTFVSNRTDIQGVRNIISCIIKFACTILFLNIVSIRIYWVSAASLIATASVAIWNVKLTKILTPELSLNFKEAKKSYIKELGQSGIWMAFNSISTILLRGLDLTIVNIMIGEHEMGLLSIARTFPNTFTGIIGTIAPIFTPVFISLYTKSNMDKLVRKVKDSINVCVLILYVPICAFIVFSKDFYLLWQNSLSRSEVEIITILSTITVIQAFFNSATATMAQLSVVVNKLKLPVIVTFICGLISIILDFVLLKVTNLGVYAIVLSPTIVLVFRYIIFNSVYAAVCLERPKMEFVGTVMKKWGIIPVLFVMMIIIKRLIPVHGWGTLVVDIILCAVIGYGMVICLLEFKKAKIVIKTFIRKLKGVNADEYK